MINLQQTHLDEKTSIRIWAKLDDVFTMLANNLSIKPYEEGSPIPKEDIFIVPYAPSGQRDPASKMILDLSPGALFKICHPLASNLNAQGAVVKRDKEGNWDLNVQVLSLLPLTM